MLISVVPGVEKQDGSKKFEGAEKDFSAYDVKLLVESVVVEGTAEARIEITQVKVETLIPKPCVRKRDFKTVVPVPSGGFLHAQRYAEIAVVITVGINNYDQHSDHYVFYHKPVFPV